LNPRPHFQQHLRGNLGIGTGGRNSRGGLLKARYLDIHTSRDQGPHRLSIILFDPPKYDGKPAWAFCC
jgi:hypothetical protein